MAIDYNKLIFPKIGSFNVWHYRELFVGKESGPWKVPNEGDIVYTDQTGIKRVVDVDVTTGKFLWEDYNPYGVLVTDPRQEQNDPDSVAVKLQGLGHGVPSDTSRLYLDTTVFPYQVALPMTTYSANPSVTHWRIFQGTDYTDINGKVVSSYYNTAGDFVSDRIPMYKNTIEPANSVYSYPATGNCTKKLDDGSIVTVVFYSAEGIKDVRHMLVQNTDVIRRSERANTRITSMRLVSSAINEAYPNLIRLPQGSLISSLGLSLKLTYDSGIVAYVGTDDPRVKLLGADAFISTNVGARHRLTLAYVLGDSEINDTGLSESLNGDIVDGYDVVIDTIDAQYASKVFVAPNYLSVVEGYTLKLTVMNLGHGLYSDVSNLCTITGFDPLLYDVEQEVIIQLQMSDVSTSLPSSLQTYIVYLTLHDPLVENQTSWDIAYELGQEVTSGTESVVTLAQEGSGEWTYNFSLGITQPLAWMNALYWPTKPLYDPSTELQAPVPDRFRVKIGDKEIDKPITEFNVPITTTYGLQDYKTLNVMFYRTSGNGDQYTSVVGLEVRRV